MSSTSPTFLSIHTYPSHTQSVFSDVKPFPKHTTVLSYNYNSGSNMECRTKRSDQRNNQLSSINLIHFRFNLFHLGSCPRVKPSVAFIPKRKSSIPLNCDERVGGRGAKGREWRIRRNSRNEFECTSAYTSHSLAHIMIEGGPTTESNKSSSGIIAFVIRAYFSSSSLSFHFSILHSSTHTTEKHH